MRSRRLVALALVLTGLAGVPGVGQARVYLSKAEALEQAFPDADRVESETYILDADQVRSVESLAHAPLDSKLVTIHRGLKDGEVTGWALIDVHTVRTLPEAFLIVVSPRGEVESLRLLAFHEPGEYRPPDRWLEQFRDQTLSEKLRLNARIHGIAGSTLSSRAVTRGVRRALALWKVLVRGAEAPPAPAASPGGGLGPGR